LETTKFKVKELKMPITEILARNAALYGEEISLVEINPQIRDIQANWRDYELVEPDPEKNTGGK